MASAPPTSAQVGAAIRRFREERGPTIETLADAAELDVSYLSGIERGLRNPSWNVIRAILDALEVKAVDLMQRAEESVQEEPER